ncbi:MAG: hypothetical protein ACRC0F_00835 [Cetobacterium sp.]
MKDNDSLSFEIDKVEGIGNINLQISNSKASLKTKIHSSNVK